MPAGGPHDKPTSQTSRDIITEPARLPMSTDSMRRIVLCFVALTSCAAATAAFAQRGAMTLPRNLDELTDRASDIVRGTVVDARVEKHPELDNLHTIVVTLSVRETLKGDARGTYTFRQYIWDMRDRQDAAGYRKGQDLLLLMNAPSRYGLSSPVGLEQGRFRIERDRSGREVALNGTGNLRLFERLQDAKSRPAALTERQSSLVVKHRSGPIALEDVAAMIRAYTENGG
jgi:Ni/Co efflux regulator RcnB